MQAPRPMWNFCARIADAAARFPDRPAIELLHEGRVTETSYAGLMDAAAKAAGWLHTAGIRTGDRVAILADNDARWISSYLGALWLGAVAVPLDTAYKPAQVYTILASSGARVLFTTPKYLDTGKAACAQAGAAAPCLALIVGDAPGIAGAADLARASAAPPMADVASADAAVILYTSGTTSDPKGVVLTHANLEAERLAAFAVVSVNEDDAVLGVLPLFHALAQMANLLLPLSVGARVVFLSPVSSTTLLEALETRGITIFACVPQFFYLIHQRATAEVAKRGRLARTMVRGIVGGNGWLRDRVGVNPGKRVFGRVHRVFGTKMRFLVTGGSKFDPAIGRDLYGMGFTLLNAYGLTETSGAATLMRPGDRFTTSVGQPLPGVEIKIAERARNVSDVNADQNDGEVVIRGPVIMREYFGRPDATAESIKDGWLYTGDLGRIDADGRLYITGRSKEIIVLASGKNLYPEEIEAHYRQSPFIKELCVLGLSRPGEPAAERLHAVIVPDEHVLRERGIVNVRELVRFELEGLSVQLPAYKRILSYDIWLEPLPRTTTGKLKRPEIERRIRERATDAPADARPLTDAERQWLADPDRARLMAFVSARLDRPTIPPDANLELDLGLDSMERVELLTALEQQCGTRVSPETRATIFTLRALVDAVLVAERAAQDTAGDDLGDQPWDVLLRQSPDPALVATLERGKSARAVLAFVVLGIAGLVMRALLRFRTSGQEHLPRTGPFIISPNHQAYLDGFVLAAALPYRTLRDVFLVGAAEYFATPFTAWLARLANIVPVDPDANLVTAMQAGAAGLRAKKALVLFPEGERSIDGDLKTFRKGAAILSSHLGAPIVPVALDGLYDLWPRGRRFNWRGLLPWRATPLRVQFGAPIPVARGDYARGTQTLRDAVEKMLKSMR